MEGVLEHVSDGVVLLDPEWQVHDVNRRAELLFGRRRAEFVGHDFWTLFPYLVDTPAEAELRRAAEGTLVRQFRVFHPPRYAWHDVMAVPGPRGLSLVIRDVTDVARARQSEAVREAVREVIDQAPIAISLLRGPDHRVEVMNQMARQILGGQNLEGRSARAALPELEGQGLFELLDRVYATGQAYEARAVPVRFDRFGDGRLYEGRYDIAYQPIFDVDGRVAGILSLSVEVTEIAAERAQLARRRAELEAVLSQLAEGVVITDAEGRVTFANEAAERLHGAALAGAAFLEPSDAIALLAEDGDPYPPDKLPLARAVLHGEFVRGARWRIRRPDGSEAAVEGDARPVLDADGTTIAAVLTLRVTDASLPS